MSTEASDETTKKHGEKYTTLEGEQRAAERVSHVCHVLLEFFLTAMIIDPQLGGSMQVVDRVTRITRLGLRDHVQFNKYTHNMGLAQ